MKTTKHQLKNTIKEEILTLLESDEKSQLQRDVRGTSSSTQASSLSTLSAQEVELVQILRQMQQIATEPGNQATSAVSRYLQMARDEMVKGSRTTLPAAGEPAQQGAAPTGAPPEDVMAEELVEKIIQRLAPRSK
tara:strand:- start:7870 stop:8274 length:405 start_codon:yes stop_codon:yes gene_type:complete